MAGPCTEGGRTHRRTSESIEGMAAGTWEFAGWVAVKWPFPMYPGMLAELQEVKRGERRSWFVMQPRHQHAVARSAGEIWRAEREVRGLPGPRL